MKTAILFNANKVTFKHTFYCCNLCQSVCVATLDNTYTLYKSVVNDVQKMYKNFC